MNNSHVLLLAASLFAVGFSGIALGQRGMPIDQVPMYGGMNRSANPTLKAADDKFVEGVTREFGSRETASDKFVSYAFDLYRRNDLARAMARFNQAWLLNPDNPQAFWGFAAVLNDRDDFCGSLTMMERAIELGIPPVNGFLADAGVVAGRCALTSTTLTPLEKKRYLEKSEELLTRAEREDPNKAYVYGSWARAYRDQERYAEAWQMVTKQRAAGGKPDERFLSRLRSEFAEPVQQ